MKVTPKYLEGIVDESSKTFNDDVCLNFNLAIGKTKQFEVYYSGALETIDDVLYINGNYNSDTENVERVFIKEVNSDKMYIIYDGLIHGYDNLFCNEHDISIERPLYQLELEGEKLFSVEMTLFYGIDFDDEKEDYDMDEEGMQHVYNRKEKLSWEQVKEEGFDAISIQFVTEEGNSAFLDLELA